MTATAARIPAGIAADLQRLSPLLGELCDLKRIRSAQDGGRSVAEQAFRRSWRRLLSGHAPAEVAVDETALACAAARLGPLGPGVLGDVGLGARDVTAVMAAAIGAVAAMLPHSVADILVRAVQELDDDTAADDDPLPVAVELLAVQPRAGATRPGRPRLVLEPAESHAEHCQITAVIGALLALAADGDPGPPFLLGLSHHLHNAYLPDAGFTGEELLGRHLGPVMNAVTDRALADLPLPLARRIGDARRHLSSSETAEGRAFNAADVLDRVLQMAHYAHAARFELRTALDDLDLVHPGPLQRFQHFVLSEAGLWPC